MNKDKLKIIISKLREGNRAKMYGESYLMALDDVERQAEWSDEDDKREKTQEDDSP